jgi:hypothetical protein
MDLSPRLSLHQILKTLLGNSNVYFQPPATVKLSYPCIIYRRNDIGTDFANDLPYTMNKQYQITVIDQDPDSLIPDKVGEMPKCSFDRHFTADNLNHDVYNLYY